MMYFGAAGAAILLTAAFVSDIRTMRIPNRLNFAALAAGVLFHMAESVWNRLNDAVPDARPWLLAALEAAGQGLLTACAGAGTGFALMLLLYRLGAVGGGDVKLFAALGSWIGAQETIACAIYAILAAGAYGLMCLIIGRRRAVHWKLLRENEADCGAEFSAEAGRNAGVRKCRFPFMIAVIPGAIAAWLW
ncbi:MAG: prepilin peptidase [Thermobacillus sp.]|uniref:A24 family peptidase n=1 Tax=Thermobacillus sp. TaxID=2108467 RepID=UPI000E36B180|nr:A24 family peptidase [Thermobacillus sp.]REK57409.1 MAG: prepilin peptidase [Thermobacillus sp.]